MALAAVPAQAQWSIGQPGNRVAPAGQQRFVLLVMIDPLPGTESVFNEFYQNTHMGDLVQLTHLDISYNELPDVPESLAALKQMDFARMSFNFLSFVPTCVCV